MLLAIFAFLAAFLLMASLGLLLFYRQTTLRRLSQVVSRADDNSVLRSLAPAPGSRLEKLVKPFQKIVPRNSADVSIVQKRLARAGYREPSYINIFYSSKVLVPMALCLVATVTQLYTYSPLFVYALAAGLGYLAPDFWLGRRISTRQSRIRRGLPDVLDLLIICIEAGLSLDQGTARTSVELKMAQPELCDELSIVVLEQRAGRPRGEAWKHLAERTDVDAVRNLTTMLVQAEQFGTSIAKTLRVHSDTLRTQRVQQVEEAAAKTTIKLLFPLVFFIFPSLFVVALGPAAISIMENFK